MCIRTAGRTGPSLVAPTRSPRGGSSPGRRLVLVAHRAIWSRLFPMPASSRVRSRDDRPVPLPPYALMAESRFPKPIRIGSRAVRWLEQEVLDFIASRPRGGSDRPGA